MNNILAEAAQIKGTPLGIGRELSPDIIAGRLFSFHDRAHFFHLQTTSYAQHKMLDDLYKGLVDAKDDISEYLLGIQAPQRFTSIVLEQTGDFSQEALTAFLEDGFNFSVSLCQYADTRNLEELCNLASDLQKLFVRSKYLNTLM